MRKINTILSIISLFVTSFVLIVIIFAWYVSNSTATVRGATGLVKDRSQIVDEVVVYNFSKKEPSGSNDVLTIDRYTGDGQSGDVTMKEYEQYNLDHVPTEYLIEIKFNSASNISQFDIRSHSSYFAGYPGNGYIVNANTISLTSVMKFKVLDNVTFNNGQVTYATPAANSFTSFSFNASTKAMTNTTINIASDKNNISSLYVLLDYNEEYINDLYTNNIGNSVVEDVDYLSFINDFDFMLFGSVVE